jgi:uncharacterized protein YecE (DUF72 family)
MAVEFIRGEGGDMAKARIGISGWRYAPWRGTFYPAELVQREELNYASRHVASIEINGSFYALQSAASYAHWYGQTPRGFMFSVKAPRFITHVRRLRDIEGPLANFMASGILQLREKLGPILWQFPPSMVFDAERFEAFLALLPHDTEKAGMLARRHDGHLHGPASTTADRKRKLRHAVEIRHKSFAVPEFIALLRKYRVALVVADTAGKWPYMEDVTAGFMYLRLHGDEAIYESGYTEKALQAWSKKVASWMAGGQPRSGTRVSQVAPRPSAGRDVFVYFDNDMKVKAPRDAARLREILKA